MAAGRRKRPRGTEVPALPVPAPAGARMALLTVLLALLGTGTLMLVSP